MFESSNFSFSLPIAYFMDILLKLNFVFSEKLLVNSKRMNFEQTDFLWRLACLNSCRRYAYCIKKNLINGITLNCKR